MASDAGLTMDEVRSARRNQKISHVRTAVSYLAAIELRCGGAKIAAALELSEKGVSRCLPRRSGRSYWGIERGKELIDNDKKMPEYVQ